MPAVLMTSRIGPKKTVLLALAYHLHEFHTGVARYARQAGWILDRRLMFASVLDPEPYRLLQGTHADGIIAFLAPGTPLLNDLVRAAKVPVVDLANNLTSLPVARVLQQNQDAGRMGAEYLIARGFDHLVFYSTLGRPNARERFEGFSAAAREAGKQAELLVWQEGSPRASYAEAPPWLAAQLARRPHRIAVMAEDDWAAIHVLEACELTGAKVPEHVAVLGIDDDAFAAELTRVPLSSVDTDRDRIAYEAAALLDRMMNGQPIPDCPLRFPPRRIVTRLSTDTYAIEAPAVSSALAFIRDNLERPISVDDVANHVGASKRTLQSQFQELLRQSISGEITRVRVERAKSLLCETDLKMSTIATRCGFGSAERMSKVFVRVEGSGPAAYRKTYRAIAARQSARDAE